MVDLRWLKRLTAQLDRRWRRLERKTARFEARRKKQLGVAPKLAA